MDDPPKAHRWVQAGKMPALPGGRPPIASTCLGETQDENCWGRTPSLYRHGATPYIVRLETLTGRGSLGGARDVPPAPERAA